MYVRQCMLFCKKLINCCKQTFLTFPKYTAKMQGNISNVLLCKQYTTNVCFKPLVDLLYKNQFLILQILYGNKMLYTSISSI